MASTFTPAPTSAPSRPRTGARAGYVVGVAVNAVMLWVAHQLLGWGWPGFLTSDFDRILGVLSASFVAGIVVNAVFLVNDRGRVKPLGDLVTAVFGVLVGLRTWDVFPFDFSGYDHNWSWLVRTFLVVAVVGSAIAVLVNLVKLAFPPRRVRG